jgi:transcriptional regulator with XRE-family HTH domain
MDEDSPHKKIQILIAFGATVRRFREEQGFSQESFSETCGLDRTYIGGVERGERNIGLVNVHRIADALKLDACELFRGVIGK